MMEPVWGEGTPVPGAGLGQELSRGRGPWGLLFNCCEYLTQAVTAVDKGGRCQVAGEDVAAERA